MKPQCNSHVVMHVTASVCCFLSLMFGLLLVLIVSVFSDLLLLWCRLFLALAGQVGNMQLVTLMAETMGSSVDPSSLVGMEDDAGASLSQANTQPE